MKNSSLSVFSAVIVLSSLYGCGSSASGSLPQASEAGDPSQDPDSSSATNAQASSAASSAEVLSEESLRLRTSTARLGYNLDYPGEWTALPPFIDQMKNTRVFAGQCDSECGSEVERAARLDLDVAGWPRSLRFRDDASQSFDRISKALVTADYRDDVGERFVVTWEGQGTVEVSEADVLSGSTSSGRFVFELGASTHFISIEQTDPEGTGQHVRNLKVFREDYEPLLEAGEIFDPVMLDYLKPFSSLRFMDWMNSNIGGLCSGGARHGEECYAELYESCGEGQCVMPGAWDQRPTIDQTSWLSGGQFLDPEQPQLGLKSGGYALETMVALANKVGADPHFNMPITYDEQYVRNFAQAVLEQLDPALLTTVEYSNEVWNWAFPQADYAHELGQRMMPDVPGAYLQYMAGRTNDMCKIWKEVFTGQEERIRCVISPQTGYRDIAVETLNCPDYVKATGEGENCTSAVDAVSVAGYFSGCLPDNTELLRQWIDEEGLEEARNMAFEQLLHNTLIGDCEEDSLDYAIESYSFFQGLAEARGLGLYVYESGTHFEYAPETREGVYDSDVAELLISVTQDERIYDAYTRNFRGFQDAGGGVFNVWGWVAQDAMWSNANSSQDRNHPKYRAILDFVNLK